ncbi:hypothetical protein LTR91_002993 [Friedmanniomyces endolithicus]|uniref:Uncharacterized protein n=1 Tax=Friedmanniomyces endolithicus TaxID=329885 RepID=A0AAN6FXB3_9PEZI|nr:hypothetical protein LTR35_004014 [Friedmanniomyces endolithicus]KAK0300166.1 hypothetical protein LTS00_001238 [Friedmanniomyces endolithicus]KAK0325030.1 hypothetical protein LTR82_004016 [Friedmanniomyces endolithicus]KAK0927846.1 hypothetical protein LTR57_003089 [Friedmanniomyces endolithicus]KAK0999471.1 hypothetical protein LTR54_009216 [Friedmanniomyces endolithicus]
MVAEPRPVATTSTTAMRPNDIMLPQASLDLPTSASTFTDTSAYAVFTAAPTSAQYTNPPIKTNLPCILCGDALPGIDAGLPTYTASYPVHTPTAAITGGDFILNPTYHGAVWYRQPWTIPAAWLLCCYVLCSCVVMGVLTYTGRLDMHGNLHVGRLGRIYRQRRSLYNERMREWASGISTWEDTAPYHLENPQEIEVNIREQRGDARISAIATRDTVPEPSIRLSVAATEIIHDPAEHERAAQRWSMEALRAVDGPSTELQTNPADAGDGHHYFLYRSDDRRVDRATSDGAVPRATDAERLRIRHMATHEHMHFERQVQMLRMHHLHDLQASMARAGWM